MSKTSAFGNKQLQLLAVLGKGKRATRWIGSDDALTIAQLRVLMGQPEKFSLKYAWNEVYGNAIKQPPPRVSV